MNNINPNSESSATHKAQIRRALENGEELTPLDALNRFGCFRLGARIWDLRHEGMNIQKTMRKTSTGKKIASYKLV